MAGYSISNNNCHKYDQDSPDPDLRTESQGKGALSKSRWTVRGYIPHILRPVQTESQGAISK